MDPSLAAKAAADAAGRVLNESVLGSLLILALLVCGLLGWLLYRAWTGREGLQTSCQKTVLDLHASFQKTLQEVQDKRDAMVSKLSDALSANATGTANLARVANDRLPMLEEIASNLKLLAQEAQSTKEGWGHRVLGIENALTNVQRATEENRRLIEDVRRVVDR